MMALATALLNLSKPRVLKSMNFFSNFIHDDGAKCLAYLVLQRNEQLVLREFVLDDNYIGDAAGAAAFGSVLKEDTSLQVLSLLENTIGNNGASSLAEALEENDTLIKLMIGFNAIDNEGCLAFGRALAHNESLEYMDLCGCNFGSEGLVEMVVSLKHSNNTLRSLFLSHNRLGTEGAVAMKSVLLCNQSLTCLAMFHCDIEKEGAFAIVEGLEGNSSLKTLILGSDIELEGAVAIKNLLAQGKNKTLVRVTIHDTEEDENQEQWPLIQQIQQEINYCCGRNRTGWWRANSEDVPIVLWPRILENVSNDSSWLYGFLREKRDLFIGCLEERAFHAVGIDRRRLFNQVLSEFSGCLQKRLTWCGSFERKRNHVVTYITL